MHLFAYIGMYLSLITEIRMAKMVQTCPRKTLFQHSGYKLKTQNIRRTTTLCKNSCDGFAVSSLRRSHIRLFTGEKKQKLCDFIKRCNYWSAHTKVIINTSAALQNIRSGTSRASMACTTANISLDQCYGAYVQLVPPQGLLGMFCISLRGIKFC